MSLLIDALKEAEERKALEGGDGVMPAMDTSAPPPDEGGQPEMTAEGADSPQASRDDILPASRTEMETEEFAAHAATPSLSPSDDGEAGPVESTQDFSVDVALDDVPDDVPDDFPDDAGNDAPYDASDETSRGIMDPAPIPAGAGTTGTAFELPGENAREDAREDIRTGGGGGTAAADAADPLPGGGFSLDEVSEAGTDASPPDRFSRFPPGISGDAVDKLAEPAGSAAGQAGGTNHAGAGAVGGQDSAGPPVASPVQAEALLSAKESRWASPRRRLLLLAGVLPLLLGTAIAGYYYWNLSLIEQTAMRPLPVAAPLMEAPGTEAGNTETGTAEGETRKAGTSPAPAPQLQAASPSKPPVDPRQKSGPGPASETRSVAPRSVAPTRPVAATPARDARPPARKPAAAEATRRRNAGIRIERGMPGDTVYPLLQQAYQAYETGRLGEARRLYEEVLSREATNRDAMLGLAAVALRGGDREQARALYRRRLEIEPKDTLARAALLSLLEGEEPAARESALKALLRQGGDVAHVHFALGNLYAGQKRWSAAQAAYFRAAQMAPRNADYAFNLAVSLEHLGRHRQALAFYRRAARLAGKAPVGFDRRQVLMRIEALQRITEAPVS